MTHRSPTPSHAEPRRRIERLEQARDEEHELELQAFRAKFGLRDMRTETGTVPPRPPMTEEHAQRRAAFREKFGLRDLSKGVPETHSKDGKPAPSKADARADFRARFGLADLSKEGA
jgi:hypothetical protein